MDECHTLNIEPKKPDIKEYTFLNLILERTIDIMVSVIFSIDQVIGTANTTVASPLHPNENYCYDSASSYYMLLPTQSPTCHIHPRTGAVICP